MKERILEKLKRAEVSVHKIRENTPESLGEFTALGIIRDGILKNLEEAIQNILDACALIVKEMDLGVPGDEAGLIRMLEDNNVIEKETATVLYAFQGLRNRLVHAYGTIDDTILFKNIKENLDDFSKVIGRLRRITKDKIK